MDTLVSTDENDDCVDCEDFVRGCPPTTCEVTVAFERRTGSAEHCGFRPWTGSQELRYLKLTTTGTYTRTGDSPLSTSVSTEHTYEPNDGCNITCTGSVTYPGAGGPPETLPCNAEGATPWATCQAAAQPVALGSSCNFEPWMHTNTSATHRTETLESDDAPFCVVSATVQKVLSGLRPISSTIDAAIADSETKVWVATTTPRCSEINTDQPLANCGARVQYIAARFRFTNPNPTACPNIRVLYDERDESGPLPVITPMEVEIEAPATQSAWIDLLVDPAAPFGSRLCIENIRAEAFTP